jgi:hypothetical protein
MMQPPSKHFVDINIWLLQVEKKTSTRPKIAGVQACTQRRICTFREKIIAHFVIILPANALIPVHTLFRRLIHFPFHSTKLINFKFIVFVVSGLLLLIIRR